MLVWSFVVQKKQRQKKQEVVNAWSDGTLEESSTCWFCCVICYINTSFSHGRAFCGVLWHRNTHGNATYLILFFSKPTEILYICCGNWYFLVLQKSCRKTLQNNNRLPYFVRIILFNECAVDTGTQKSSANREAFVCAGAAAEGEAVFVCVLGVAVSLHPGSHTEAHCYWLTLLGLFFMGLLGIYTNTHTRSIQVMHTNMFITCLATG